MAATKTLREHYPWVQMPLISSAPMRLISGAELAAEVSLAGGLGFIAAGTDVSGLSSEISKADTLLRQSAGQLSTANNTLPIGVGVICWGLSPSDFVSAIKEGPLPAAVWLFAPKTPADLVDWATEIRKATNNATKIWVQVGSVAEAEAACENVSPEVLVVQGTDGGGHGLSSGASIMSIVPEVIDMCERLYDEKPLKRVSVMAAGAIADGRGITAAFALGASGVALGTRYLATEEAKVVDGYKEEVVRASDGGQSTVRSRVYDTLRGTEWPDGYGGRGLTNQSYKDWMNGMSVEENTKLYKETESRPEKKSSWGPAGRMTTYAGAAVGLIRDIEGAGDLTKRLRTEYKEALHTLAANDLTSMSS